MIRNPVAIRHEFVQQIPDHLEDEVVYVSIKYATAVHKCFCGCGNEVVTPLSPVDWKVTFDGVSISLYPSIGNWSFPCKSHYWIDRDTVEWASGWSEAEIEAVRALELEEHTKYFDGQTTRKSNDKRLSQLPDRRGSRSPSWLLQIKRWVMRLIKHVR